MMRNSLALNRDRQIFVTTGRVHFTKGWRFLLQAMVEYKKEITTFCLYMLVTVVIEKKWKWRLRIIN